MKVIVFWVSTSCCLAQIAPCFRGAYCLRHQSLGHGQSKWFFFAIEHLPTCTRYRTHNQCDNMRLWTAQKALQRTACVTDADANSSIEQRSENLRK